MKSIIILLILASFSGIIYFLTRKLNSKFVPALLIFAVSAFFCFFVPMSVSNEETLAIVVKNLSPATLFLFGIDLDIKKLFRNKIGCSCEMGAKRYWLFVVLGFAVSLGSQFAVISLMGETSIVLSAVLAFGVGVLLSFTKLKEIGGSEEIATTMLYLLSSIFGMQTGAEWYSL